MNKLNDNWLQVAERGSGLHTEAQLLLKVTAKRHLVSTINTIQSIVYTIFHNSLKVAWNGSAGYWPLIVSEGGYGNFTVPPLACLKVSLKF